MHRDWKKLTFYYFADAYINFNSLVTDLFKVYKTRIWMSAINAASFASPSLGLQAPSGVGPGAVGVSRPIQVERRSQQQEQPAYNSMPSSRLYQGGQGGIFSSAAERNPLPPTGFPQQSFAYGYSPFAAAPRGVPASISSYASTMVPPIDPFPGFAAPIGYQSMPARYPSPHGIGVGHEASDLSRQGNVHTTGNDGWMNSFQSLSLNSR
jgi:hypothetical protein